MFWFERLTGFRETSPSNVRQNITIDGETLTSLVNGKTWRHGRLETPSLGELRNRVRGIAKSSGRVSVQEVIANTQDLHADVSNAGGLFQVASQFNLLEMVGPTVTPEEGVGIYENDRTQGPACAIAAGAGTIYRNYFAEINGQIGQSSNNQIDCLADIGRKLDNTNNRLWEMRNGYALPSRSGLSEISTRLHSLNESALDELRQSLRIGLQWTTQVTISNSNHTVSQAYCSALPVAYSSHSADLWEPFARLVLEATYEATICAAILNSATRLDSVRTGNNSISANDNSVRTGNNSVSTNADSGAGNNSVSTNSDSGRTGNHHVFLTLVGGGAFGNEPEWIAKAIDRALRLYQHHNLNVTLVSFGRSNPHIHQLVESFSF